MFAIEEALMADLGPVEQAFAFSQAIDQNPALATPEGRAEYELQRTLHAIVAGVQPVQTVLGGLMTHHAIDKSNEPMSESRICARANLDPHNYLGVFTVEQILEDLVKVGVLEAFGHKQGSLDELLYGSVVRKYRIRAPLSLQIERLDPEADAAKEAEARARYEAMYNQPRKGLIATILQERRARKWVKLARKELANNSD